MFCIYVSPPKIFPKHYDPKNTKRKLNNKRYVVSVDSPPTFVLLRSRSPLDNSDRNKDFEIGVEIIKFKGNLFSDDQRRYCITLQVNPDSGEFIELFDAEAYYENGIFTATYEQLLKIKPEPIESMKFEYLCSGFHHEYED